jgi:formylglycine-generating enzyme required for sulfatase activity
MKTAWFVRLAVAVLAMSGFARAGLAQKPVIDVHLNCGGKATTGWARDRVCTNGYSLKTVAPILKAKRAPMAVYQSCRVAPKLTYSFPTLPNGEYLVYLHFAELVYTAPGSRLFHVKLEGLRVLSNLDVFSRAGGKNRALRLAFRTVVKDANGLQVQLQRKRGDSILSGLEVIPIRPSDDLVWVDGGANSGSNPMAVEEVPSDAYPATYNLSEYPFYISATEVTKDMWDTVAAWGSDNGYTDLPAGGGKAGDHPVQQVNWYDCIKWCNARSQMEGLPPAYYADDAHTAFIKTGTGFDVPSNRVDWAAGYRLPRSSQWEFAARGGLNGTRFPWGDTIAHSNANYFSVDQYAYDVSATRGYHGDYSSGAYPHTSPALSFDPNAFGLYGMVGNVAEWCWDWHPNGIGSQRMARGGDFGSNAIYARVGHKPYMSPEWRYENIGFRVVLPVVPPAVP